MTLPNAFCNSAFSLAMLSSTSDAPYKLDGYVSVVSFNPETPVQLYYTDSRFYLEFNTTGSMAGSERNLERYIFDCSSPDDLVAFARSISSCRDILVKSIVGSCSFFESPNILTHFSLFPPEINVKLGRFSGFIIFSLHGWLGFYPRYLSRGVRCKQIFAVG